MKLISIDPSLNNIGYSIYTLDKYFNIIDIYYNMYPINSDWEEEKKLFMINIYTNKILKENKIDYLAMEEFHFNPKRAKAALKVAEAIGVIKSIVVKYNVKTIYISPQQVKKISGSGKADKLMVANFIKEELNINNFELNNNIRVKGETGQVYINIKEIYSSELLVKKKKEHITDALTIGYVFLCHLKNKMKGGELLQ